MNTSKWQSLIYCEVRNIGGYVDSSSLCSTVADCIAWYREHGIAFDTVTLTDAGDFTYTEGEL